MYEITVNTVSDATGEGSFSLMFDNEADYRESFLSQLEDSENQFVSMSANGHVLMIGKAQIISVHTPFE